eukprot:2042744-Amphidinium_carterae.1
MGLHAGKSMKDCSDIMSDQNDFRITPHQKHDVIGAPPNQQRHYCFRNTEEDVKLANVQTVVGELWRHPKVCVPLLQWKTETCHYILWLPGYLFGLPGLPRVRVTVHAFKALELEA